MFDITKMYHYGHHVPVSLKIHIHMFLRLLVVETYWHVAGSKEITKSKPFIQGISGQAQQETPRDYAKWKVKLFSTIVKNNANINTVRAKVTTGQMCVLSEYATNESHDGRRPDNKSQGTS